MSEFVVKCPHCNKDITIKLEYAGQLLECPCCQNMFKAPEAITVPEAPEAPSSSRITKSYTGNYYVGNRYFRPAADAAILKFIFKLAVFLLIGGGLFWGGKEIIEAYKSSQETVTPEETNAKELNTKHIPEWFDSGKIFLYSPKSSCKFITANVKHVGGNQYEGDIEFSHKKHILKRKIVCYKNGSEFSGDVEVDYNITQHALEDVAILYELLCLDNPGAWIKDWEFSSASLRSGITVNDEIHFDLVLKQKYSYTTKSVLFFVKQLGRNDIRYGIK